MGGSGVNSDDAFERILAALHEAALDDTRWPAAAALIDEACGAVGNMLLVGERSGEIHFVRSLHRGEAREDLAREYFEVYYPHDEGPLRRRELPNGLMTHTSELYTETQLKTSVAYNEGWRLMRGQNGLSVSFEQPDGLRIFWGVGDPVDSGGYESAQLRLLERLLPHIHRCVVIRQALAAADALGAGLTGLLDRDRVGVVQLDRAGRVLEANAPALEILRRGDGLIDRDGVLDACLPADRSRLRQLLARALPDLWDKPPSGGSMTVQRPSRRSRLGLHVSPVGVRTSDFGRRRVAVLVLVVDPTSGSRIEPARVAALLGLTPSESRVSALLAEGLSVREIAAATDLRESYVRWLFQRVYKKLGVSGQVALVRQVLAADALPWR